MTEHREYSSELQIREKSLLQQMEHFSGFPFVEGEIYLPLGEVMRRFKFAALDNVGQVAKGELNIEDMQRHIVYVTGLPGVGKTTLARGLIKGYVDVVAAMCAELGEKTQVVVAEFDEYAERYVGQGKEFDIDRSKPYPPEILEKIGRRMDEDVANILKQDLTTNTIVIMDRPGGVQAPLITKRDDKKPTEWVARSYGTTGGDMVQDESPFGGIRLHVTSIGVIGGPSTVQGVIKRDNIIASDMSLEVANNMLIANGLPPMTMEELEWNKRGAPKATVDAVHVLQRALVFNFLSIAHQERLGTQKEQYVPQFVIDIIALSSLEISTEMIDEYCKYDPRLRALWAEVQEVAAKQSEPENNPFTILQNLCWDFAGAQILRHSVGMDNPNSLPRPSISTIIYND